MTRIWWVRHGPTHAREMIGWTDRPADLTDLDALERLRAYLPAEAPVVSSDLSRAIATAAALGRSRTLSQVPDLREIHFGAWEGLRFDEAQDRDPELIRRFWEDPGEVAAPGGESWQQLRRRVDVAVDRLVVEHSGDIIAVAHFGPILTQVERALRIPTTLAFAQKIEPLSVTCIEHEGKEILLRSVNHSP